MLSAWIDRHGWKVILAFFVSSLGTAMVFYSSPAQERPSILIGSSTLMVAPPHTIWFFSADQGLTISDMGAVTWQGRTLGTDEEIFWGLQEMLKFFYDRERLCSRADALAALRAAFTLRRAPGDIQAETTFMEGYHKCFPPN